MRRAAGRRLLQEGTAAEGAISQPLATATSLLVGAGFTSMVAITHPERLWRPLPAVRGAVLSL